MSVFIRLSKSLPPPNQAFYIQTGLPDPFYALQLEALFRHKVLHRLVALDKITSARVELVLSWKHSGFNIHRGRQIQPGDAQGQETRTAYLLHAPINQQSACTKHDCRLRILRRPGRLNVRNPPWSQDCEPECKQSRAWQTGLFFSGVPARAFHGIPAPDSHLTRRLYARLCPPPLSTSGFPLGLACPQCYSTFIAKKPISYILRLASRSD